MENVERTLFSALVGLAGADGRIAPQEAAWLQGIMQAVGVDLEDARRPLDRANLKSVLPRHEDRLRLLQLGLLVAQCDGHVADAEVEYLAELARDLDVSESELADLRSRTPGL